MRSSAPRAGKTVAALSLVMWVSIIFMGRMIGFTTSRAAVAAPTGLSHRGWGRASAAFG